MACGEKRIERRLLCALTDEDVQSWACMLGETVVEIDDVTAARAERNRQFKEHLAGLNRRQRELSSAIKNREEYRHVPCVMQYHAPEVGQKQVIRLDSGEVIETDAMMDGEKQLHLFVEATLEQEIAEVCAAMDAAAAPGEPSAADLDATAAEQKAAEETAGELAPIDDPTESLVCSGCGYARCDCPSTVVDPETSETD